VLKPHDERELEERVSSELADGAAASHAERWPEGCPGPCAECAGRLADRCHDSRGHVFTSTWKSGDTCYCGTQVIVKYGNGRIEVFNG
jgi:hypothetical protein